jgi:hypothetical protein
MGEPEKPEAFKMPMARVSPFVSPKPKAEKPLEPPKDAEKGSELEKNIPEKNISGSEKSEKSADLEPENPVKQIKSPAELLKERSEAPLQYSEPKWAGVPPEDQKYCLEELKNGTIVKSHKLTSKSYFVIGMYQYAQSAHATICSALTKPLATL